MAVLALVLTVAWIGLVAGFPVFLQLQRTGEVARFARDRPGSPQWWARLVSILGFVLAIGAPVAALAGLPPIPALDAAPVWAVGVGLVVLGIVVTLTAQAAMGPSWRGSVDPDVETGLVTSGPFRWVRNPIFSGSVTTATGLALMVPNVLAAAMLLAFVASLEIQVRLVEEP